MGKEPRQLKEGKKFHRKVQGDWVTNAAGEIFVEKSIVKPNGRGGRIDVHVSPDDEMVAIVEIKASDWDKMTERNIRRNIKRQSRQI